MLRQAGIAVVAVGSGPSVADLDWVSADDELIAYDAVTHLLTRGPRRVATITGPANASPGAQRLRGYLRAMADQGKPEDQNLIVAGDWTRDGGSSAMSVLLDLPDRPTAVFCANDVMAIGALDAAFGRGLRVPYDSLSSASMTSRPPPCCAQVSRPVEFPRSKSAEPPARCCLIGWRRARRHRHVTFSFNTP